MKIFHTATICVLAGTFLFSTTNAQLTDSTQTGPSVPGGTIAKSLSEQIGTGYGDEYTYGSSAYLIKRDPARSIRRGRQLFQRKFSEAQGMGPRVNVTSTGSIQDNIALGAGLADSCAACHGRPRGAAGFGGDVATRPDSRDAPHLFGLGLIEMLADEITSDLRYAREQALRKSQQKGRPAHVRLRSKGIDFGRIKVYPDGRIDSRGLQGVDSDLRVKPLFHDGTKISIREFIFGAFNDEMGLQSPDPVLCAVTDPVNPVAMISAAGMVFDPGQDTFNRPPVCGESEDGDGDGVVNEIDPAVVDHMEFYLLNYFKPGQGEMTHSARRGLRIIERIGCTECHVQNLTVNYDRRIADVDTQFDPENGIFNRLFATVSTRFDVIDDGEAYPQLVPQGKPFVVRGIFTDFRRHDLGPAFHERQHDGAIVKEFITEPLWGVATTAPYGHDGRSINLTEVILRHGGEARRSKRAFARLSESARESVLAFLGTLILFPPDDTASNLDPGKPDGDPQSEHGSIALGELFQIAGEGAE